VSADRRQPIRRTKDGTRRIVTTPSQTFTVKLTKGEIEYLDWIEGKRETGTDRVSASLDDPHDERVGEVTPADDRLLDAGEVAELLHVPVSWVRAESRAGRIPTVTLGRYRRYRRQAVLAWLEEREETSRRYRPRVTT